MGNIKIGSVGLGRLGLRHAENIALKVMGAELTALCDKDTVKLNSTADRLGVKHRFESFEEMAAMEDLDAVLIASPSAFHPEQIIKALNEGKHVFSEKPLGVTMDECRKAEKAVENNPDKVFMLGFMRRFDPSYRYAKEKIDAGDIGRIIMIRSYSQDPEKFIDGAIAYAGHSGGEFLDKLF